MLPHRPLHLHEPGRLPGPPDGDVSWLAGQDPDDPDPGTYPAFLSTVDTVVMGWTTYHQVVTQLSPGSWPYRGLDCYVSPTAPSLPRRRRSRLSAVRPTSWWNS